LNSSVDFGPDQNVLALQQATVQHAVQLWVLRNNCVCLRVVFEDTDVQELEDVLNHRAHLLELVVQLRENLAFGYVFVIVIALMTSGFVLALVSVPCLHQ
jgi:hypothetical protein